MPNSDSGMAWGSFVSSRVPRGISSHLARDGPLPLPPAGLRTGSLRSFGCCHSLSMTMPYPSSALTLIRGVFLTHTSWLTLAFCEMFTRHFGHIVFLTNLLEIL
jgi:hypothetical protein